MHLRQHRPLRLLPTHRRHRPTAKPAVQQPGLAKLPATRAYGRRPTTPLATTEEPIKADVGADPTSNRPNVLAARERWCRDSNPGRSYPLTRFRGVLLRPLGHTTAE